LNVPPTAPSKIEKVLKLGFSLKKKIKNPKIEKFLIDRRDVSKRQK